MRGRRQVKAQNLPSSGGVHAGGDDDRDVALNDLLESRSYTTSADSKQPRGCASVPGLKFQPRRRLNLSRPMSALWVVAGIFLIGSGLVRLVSPRCVGVFQLGFRSLE